MSDLYEKISFYKGLYKEIAVGFSEDKFLEKPIFIKHFTELENGNLDKDRRLFSGEALKKGLEEKEEMLQPPAHPIRSCGQGCRDRPFRAGRNNGRKDKPRRPGDTT